MRKTILVTSAFFLAAIFLTASLAANSDQGSGGRPAMAEGKAGSALESVALLFGTVLAVGMIGGGVFLAMRKKHPARAACPKPTETSPAPLLHLVSPPVPTPDARQTAGYASLAACSSDAPSARTMALSSSTAAMAPEAGAVPCAAGAMVCLTGPLAGRRFEVTAEGFFIGRDSVAVQAVIADPCVSGRHAWVGLRNGRAVVIDAGSTNGTFVNAVGNGRVREAALNPGDTVIISGTDLARFIYQK